MHHHLIASTHALMHAKQASKVCHQAHPCLCRPPSCAVQVLLRPHLVLGGTLPGGGRPRNALPGALVRGRGCNRRMGTELANVLGCLSQPAQGEACKGMHCAYKNNAVTCWSSRLCPPAARKIICSTRSATLITRGPCRPFTSGQPLSWQTSARRRKSGRVLAFGAENALVDRA